MLRETEDQTVQKTSCDCFLPTLWLRNLLCASADTELSLRAARPNVFIKIPGTSEAVPASGTAAIAHCPVQSERRWPFCGDGPQRHRIWLDGRTMITTLCSTTSARGSFITSWLGRSVCCGPAPAQKTLLLPTSSTSKLWPHRSP
jgi:hypothetical protein